METKEVKNEDIKVLAQLGVDAKDIANIYLQVAQKGKDIPKATYINKLTEMMKFFQTRNRNIENEETEAIFKEDILNMVKKNYKLVELDINKNIKPICQKIDGYYFMKPGYTNKLIKNNPNIFNISSEQLESYSKLLSNYAINLDSNTTNLLEYVIKQKSDLLENDFENVSEKINKLEENKNSKLFTTEEINGLFN